MKFKGPSISHDSLWSSGQTVKMADLEEMSRDSTSPEPSYQNENASMPSAVKRNKCKDEIFIISYFSVTFVIFRLE